MPNLKALDAAYAAFAFGPIAILFAILIGFAAPAGLDLALGVLLVGPLFLLLIVAPAVGSLLFVLFNRKDRSLLFMAVATAGYFVAGWLTLNVDILLSLPPLVAQILRNFITLYVIVYNIVCLTLGLRYLIAVRRRVARLAVIHRPWA